MNSHKFIFFSFIFCCFFSYESSAQCSSNEVEIVINITTDSYPGETSWQLVDQNGNGYTNATQLTSANTTYTWNICVPNVNCYDFTIFDSWGDGICCSYGNGSYSVTHNGTVVASGGSFGTSETTSNIGSCSPVPCSASESSVTLNMYDSYGDGWNGNTWTATSINNPANSFSFTLNAGSSGSSTFCLPNDCYNIECNGGSWQSEVSWDLVENSTGNTMLSGGAPFNQMQFPVGTSSCSNNPPACLSNEEEVVITITTDNYPTETSWQLVDQNGGGFYINAGDLTIPNNTYTWTFCVPDTNCYQFTISDVFGDGICCNWGNGSYNVTYASTTVANGGNFGSSETIFNIGNCISPPSNCPNNEIEVVITIDTDDYPTETSWYLIDQFGGGWTNTPISASFSNTTLTWTICVPDTNCYSFTIMDAYGDGICCNSGNGAYVVTYNGVQIASGGSFGYVEQNCGIGYCSGPCQINIPQNVISENENCGDNNNYGCDDSWKISNFTITGVTDIWSFGGATLPNPFGGYFDVGDTPDLYVYMRKNNAFFYYSGYFTDTWYPNNGYGFSSQPLSFSMYANQNTAPLVVQTQPLLTAPYVIGQTYNYDFLVGDDDFGSFLNVFGNNDFIGSYNLPSFTNANTFSITTSGGTDGNAYVDYTTIAPSYLHDSILNNSLLHGNFWAENNLRDTDWYEFYLSDSSSFSLNAISEVPFYVFLYDAAGGCDNKILIDSIFAFACDSITLNHTLQSGNYFIATFPASYSCVSCGDSVDYLLNVSWSEISLQQGCTDSIAFNYDPFAIFDDGTCCYISGCTDSTAFNYNINACYNDGSCIPIVFGCTDSTAFNYDPIANTDDGSCIPFIYGCTDTTAFNYNPLANTDNGSCIAVVYGCTDSLAINYFVGANIDDSSCCYIIGCTDTLATNFDINACFDDGSCIYPLYGCMDSLALNYDFLATHDDGSCCYISGCTDSTAFNYNINACYEDGSCIPIVFGCTDSTAFNYDPTANTDDGSCLQIVYGCTDSTSVNYNPLANINDGSCIAIVYGCMDPLALNYYPGANMMDPNNPCC